jgi:hypothetical protein
VEGDEASLNLQARNTGIKVAYLFDIVSKLTFLKKIIMKHNIKFSLSVVFFVTLIFSLPGSVNHIQARSETSVIILTDNNFMNVAKDFYGSSIQEVLKKNNSGLVDYSRQIGEQTLTAGDVFWVSSQQRDFSINPKALVVTYVTLYGVSKAPSEEFYGCYP